MDNTPKFEQITKEELDALIHSMSTELAKITTHWRVRGMRAGEKFCYFIFQTTFPQDVESLAIPSWVFAYVEQRPGEPDTYWKSNENPLEGIEKSS